MGQENTIGDQLSLQNQSAYLNAIATASSDYILKQDDVVRGAKNLFENTFSNFELLILVTLVCLLSGIRKIIASRNATLSLLKML